MLIDLIEFIACTLLFFYFMLILLILPITYYFVIYKQQNLYDVILYRNRDAVSLSCTDPNKGRDRSELSQDHILYKLVEEV